ncbi:hypothetical protein PUN28_008823 [Cardiocondyla obscurior]|uniref:Secreted protein n=1 Tax=Cardiocondyla obscurior TaxID=286306 RepID=A0AAW2FUV4_9HYME
MCTVPVFAMGVEDVACNCEHCDEERVISLEKQATTQATYKKDSNNDGNRIICARDRSFNDRTFPNVCYMVCYNRCTRYRIVEVKENDIKKHVVVAYRPTYYKVRDGAC